MKRVLLAFAAMTLAATAAFCLDLTGNGSVKTEKRATPAFSSIDMTGVGRVNVSKGSSLSVAVTLDGNLLPHYATTVKDSVLSLGFEPGSSIRNLTRLVVDVTMPSLDGISLSGACEALLSGGFSGPKLRLAMSGTGKVSGKIDYRAVSIKASGAGQASLSGLADSLDMDIAGSVDIDGSKLSSKRVTASASGACSVSIAVSERIAGSFSGASRLAYSGAPTISVQTSGVSTITKSAF